MENSCCVSVGKLYNFPWALFRCFWMYKTGKQEGKEEKKKALYAQYLQLTMNSKIGGGVSIVFQSDFDH